MWTFMRSLGNSGEIRQSRSGRPSASQGQLPCGGQAGTVDFTPVGIEAPEAMEVAFPFWGAALDLCCQTQAVVDGAPAKRTQIGRSKENEGCAPKGKCNINRG